MRSLLINLFVASVLYGNTALPIVVVNDKNSAPQFQWRFEQEMRRIGERLWRVLRRDPSLHRLLTGWRADAAAEGKQSSTARLPRERK